MDQVTRVNRTSFMASVENRGDSLFHATTQDATFKLDTNGQAAHPIDALMGCLSACIAHHVLLWLRDSAMGNPGFTVSASGTLTPERLRFLSISVTVDVSWIPDDPTLRKGLLEYIKRCPVYNTLNIGCPIDLAFAKGR
jgi:uncharacterized OsmC-like protein